MKTGPEANVENDGPLNITSVVSRVMENIVKSVVVQHLLTSNPISISQHEFLTSRSYDTFLIDYLYDIKPKQDNGFLVSVLLLNFKNSFDKIPRKRLLVKLNFSEINDPLYSWFVVLLTERE